MGEVLLCCQRDKSAVMKPACYYEQTLLTARLPWLHSPIKLRRWMLLLSSVLEQSPPFCRAHISDNEHQWVGEAGGNQLPDVEEQPYGLCSLVREREKTGHHAACSVVVSIQRYTCGLMFITGIFVLCVSLYRCSFRGPPHTQWSSLVSSERSLNLGFVFLLVTMVWQETSLQESMFKLEEIWNLSAKQVCTRSKYAMRVLVSAPLTD